MLNQVKQYLKKEKIISIEDFKPETYFFMDIRKPDSKDKLMMGCNKLY